jgi:hypothetical protein
MTKTGQRISELLAMGYECSQIVVIMGLESRGQNNPVLIQAMAGLAWGCGEGSCTCGSLTGACCLLSLITERSGAGEVRKRQLSSLSTELVRWFWQTYGFPLGGIDCMAIREAAVLDTPPERCHRIMETVYEKVRQITAFSNLDDYGGDCHSN